jgi:xanthine dehydrogenase accessory factor
MTPALLERLLAGRRAGKPLALATAIPGGAQALIDAETAEGELILAPEDLAAIRAAIADDVSRTTKTGLGPVFVAVWNPPLRLILIGAVHIGQTLAPMAALGGYKVTVIDPRAGFARAERLPGVEIIADWPDEVLPGLAPDKRTAIVTLTHDPKIDDPALAAALRSDAFYIGALGSRRTHAKRAERLAAEGFTAAQIARIRGPVGLAIGALTPAEIAISILAEITAVLHRAGLAARPGEAA